MARGSIVMPYRNGIKSGITFNIILLIMTEIQTTRAMLEKGQDPKDYLIEVCRPQCNGLQQKLQRCEVALKNMTNADPELSCMYPFRDWVTCVDACVPLATSRFSLKSTRNWQATSTPSSPDNHPTAILSLYPSNMNSLFQGLLH